MRKLFCSNTYKCGNKNSINLWRISLVFAVVFLFFKQESAAAVLLPGSTTHLSICEGKHAIIMSTLCNPIVLGIGCGVGASAIGTATESAVIGIAAALACIPILSGQAAACEAAVAANNTCYSAIPAYAHTEFGSLYCERPPNVDCAAATTEAETITAAAKAGIVVNESQHGIFAAAAGFALTQMLNLSKNSKKSKEELKTNDTNLADNSLGLGSSSGGSSSGSSSGSSGSSSGSSGSSSGASSGSSSGSSGSSGGLSSSSSGGSSSGTASSSGSSGSSSSSGGNVGGNTNALAGGNSAKNLSNNPVIPVTPNCGAKDFSCLCNSGSSYKPLECDSSCSKNNTPDLQCLSKKFGVDNYSGYDTSPLRLDKNGKVEDLSGGGAGGSGSGGSGFSGGAGNGSLVPQLGKSDVSTGEKGSSSSSDDGGGGSGYSGAGGSGDLGSDSTASAKNKLGRDIASVPIKSATTLAEAGISDKGTNLFQRITDQYTIEYKKPDATLP